LPIRTPAWVLGATLNAGESTEYHLGKARRGYLVPASGSFEVDGVKLDARDGAAIGDVDSIRVPLGRPARPSRIFQRPRISSKAPSVASVAWSSGLDRCAMPSALDSEGFNGRMLMRLSGGGAPASCGNSAAP
jgi:hypothetical protein